MLRQQNPRHSQTSHHDISVLQINTQSKDTCNCLTDRGDMCPGTLNRDAEEDAEAQKTQTHPRYDIFGPQGTWTTRPRTMIYIRKDLEANQKLLMDDHPTALLT
jgi:hypothetical protein